MDVIMIRTNDTLQTIIYRKSTQNDECLHWNFFAPRTWKPNKLQIILIRAYKICSTKELLQNELKQIEEKFSKINGYLKWVFHQANEECKVPRNADYDNNVTVNNESISTTHGLIAPYKGEQEQKIIKLVNNYVKRSLPPIHLAQHVYNSRKLDSTFDTKEEAKLEHKHTVTYFVKCPLNSCSETYLEQTAIRPNEGVMKHADEDKKSHMLKHTLQSCNPSVSTNDFKILQKGYNNNNVRRKISEALLIRKHWPSLNIHKNSIPLGLFDWCPRTISC